MNLRDKVVIPHHWTSEEATTVIRFLYEIAEAIWEVHGDGMIEICNHAAPTARYERPYGPTASLDDEFPF